MTRRSSPCDSLSKSYRNLNILKYEENQTKKYFKKTTSQFSKCVLEAKTSLKQLKIVSEAKYGTCRSFSVFKDFSLPIFEKVLQKGCRGV